MLWCVIYNRFMMGWVNDLVYSFFDLLLSYICSLRHLFMGVGVANRKKRNSLLEDPRKSKEECWIIVDFFNIVNELYLKR